MYDTNTYIIEFVKHNSIMLAIFFYFAKNYAVKKDKVDDNSIFTLLMVTAAQVWDTVQGMIPAIGLKKKDGQ